jgi:hypothetical protein
VETFQSSKPSELEAFVANAYKKGKSTDTTVLYEAMFAGLDLIKAMPVNDPRFLVVFSDGEDINSAFKGDVVSQAAHGVPNLRVFAIDYMKDPKIDQFLASFASQNHGQARKAGTGADLLKLFQQFASRLDDYYVVNYAFAPVAGEAPKPTEPVAAAAATQPPAAATAEPPAMAAATAPPAAPAVQTTSNWWLWVLLLIVLILILLFAFRRSEEKEKK